MTRGPSSPAPAGADGTRLAGIAASASAARLAYALVAAVCLAFAATLTAGVEAEAGAAQTWLQAGCGLGVIAVQVGYVSRPGAVRTRPRTAAALVVLGVLAYLPVVLIDPTSTGLTGFLVAAVLLTDHRVGIPVGIAAAALSGWLVGWSGPAPLYSLFYGISSTVLPALVIFGLTRLARLVRQLHDASEALSRAAVAQQRRRFTRDAHALLGRSLSAITLSAELTDRLVDRDPGRARTELRDLLGTARRALGEVRMVASTSADLSWSRELTSARSVLRAADVDLSVHGRDALGDGGVPDEVEALAAALLREVVTSLLAHPSARACHVAVAVRDDRVRVTVSHDGAAADRSPGDLDDLRRRFTEAGGTLVRDHDDDTVTTVGTLPRRPVVPPATTAGTDGSALARLGVPASAPGLSYALVVVVCLIYGAITVGSVSLNFGPGGDAVVALAGAAVVAVQVGWVSRPGVRRTPARVALALGALAVLAYLPALALGVAYLGFANFLAASALILLPPRAAVPVYLAVVVVATAIPRRLGELSPEGLFSLVFSLSATGLTGLVIFGLTRLAELVHRLHDARDDLARLAVADDRSRFVRDTHDLLGLSLSAIALQAEVVDGLVEREPLRAHAELAELRATSHRALGEVSAVAEGGTALRWSDELAAVRRVLAAAEVEVSVTADDSVRLPDELTSLCATLLREAATNVLRHATAGSCRIRLMSDDEAVRLTVVNDGAAGTGRLPVDGPGRQGLENLRARFAARGGDVTGARDGEEFTLAGTLPR